MTISFPKRAKETISREIPRELIKERSGGGKTVLSYLSGSTVIDLLNQAFDYMWSWQADKEWVEESIPFFNKWEKPEPKFIEQGPVAHVRGTLTVYIHSGESIIEIKKTGYGSKSIMGKQNDQESIFKAAGTDALKKAASHLGIGLELYRDEDEQYIFLENNFENPWDEQSLKQYEDERNYIKTIMSEYDFGDEGLDPYVQEFSNNELTMLAEIVPDNISQFVKFLKTKLDTSEE